MFCKAINLNYTMYSQLINEKIKPIFNEKYVRNIEEFCNLKKGWFDIDYDNVKLDDLSIGLEEFKLGYLALNDFLNSKVIMNTDNETIAKILENLFIYMANSPDKKDIKLSKAEFLDFMK